MAFNLDGIIGARDKDQLEIDGVYRLDYMKLPEILQKISSQTKLNGIFLKKDHIELFGGFTIDQIKNCTPIGILVNGESLGKMPSDLYLVKFAYKVNGKLTLVNSREIGFDLIGLLRDYII